MYIISYYIYNHMTYNNIMLIHLYTIIVKSFNSTNVIRLC